MADNVTLPGTGAVVATDDDGTAQHQYVKIEFGADGTFTKVSAANPLPVDIVSGADGAVNGVNAHDAPISANDPVLIGAAASAAAPTAVSADGDAVRLWALRNGAMCVQITAAGALVGGDATNGIDADVTRVVPGTAASELGKAEDAVHASGDVGVMALAVRSDTAASTTSANGDYHPLLVDSTGKLHVNVGALPGVAGSAAHDAAVSGNPVLVGAEARTSDGTAVNNGDAVRLAADSLGKQVVLIGAVHDRHTRGLTNFTTNTGADVIAAAGVGVRIAVMSVLVVNGHATVGTKVSIRDGTTAKITGYAAAAGGGYTINGGGVPLFITTANTAVTAICGTTGADVDVTVSGYLIGN